MYKASGQCSRVIRYYAWITIDSTKSFDSQWFMFLCVKIKMPLLLVLFYNSVSILNNTLQLNLDQLVGIYMPFWP